MAKRKLTPNQRTAVDKAEAAWVAMGAAKVALNASFAALAAARTAHSADEEAFRAAIMAYDAAEHAERASLTLAAPLARP